MVICSEKLQKVRPIDNQRL